MILLHFFKVNGGLLYPPDIWEMELAGLIILFFLQIVRIYFGFNANRMESSGFSLVFFFLTLFCLLVILHYNLLTTYILFIEILLSIILGSLSVIELVLSLYAFRLFKYTRNISGNN